MLVLRSPRTDPVSQVVRVRVRESTRSLTWMEPVPPRRETVQRDDDDRLRCARYGGYNTTYLHGRPAEERTDGRRGFMRIDYWRRGAARRAQLPIKTRAYRQPVDGLSSVSHLLNSDTQRCRKRPKPSRPRSDPQGQNFDLKIDRYRHLRHPH